MPARSAPLAAAYAANRQSTNAIQTAQRALDAALSSGQTNLLERLRTQLKAYQSGQL